MDKVSEITTCTWPTLIGTCRPYSSHRVRHRPTHKTNDAHRCLIFHSRFSCVHRFHRRTCPLADTPLLSRTRPGATGPPSQFTHIWVNSQAGWPISIWMSLKNRKNKALLQGSIARIRLPTSNSSLVRWPLACLYCFLVTIRMPTLRKLGCHVDLTYRARDNGSWSGVV